MVRMAKWRWYQGQLVKAEKGCVESFWSTVKQTVRLLLFCKHDKAPRHQCMAGSNF